MENEWKREVLFDAKRTELERAVIDAAKTRRALQIEGRSRIENHAPTDYNLGLRYFNAIAAEDIAVDNLLQFEQEHNL